jgi:hypothetical protein
MQESSCQRDLGVAVGAQCPHERWTVPGVALLDSRLRGNDRVKRVQGLVPAGSLRVSLRYPVFYYPKSRGEELMTR